MGKASKWFRSILGLKKTDAHPHHSPSTSKPQPSPPHKYKRRWSFVKSYREKDSSVTIPATTRHVATNGGNAKSSSSSMYNQQKKRDSVPVVDRGGEVVEDPNKHAIAVAAATAAVAEAAVAAAQAAAAVVRLTSSSSSSSGRCAREPAAHINSSSYGAREEFAAVKIQSAFRGYLVSFYFSDFLNYYPLVL